ncbi:serine hydrolase [Aquirhabdus sp.]|uniref:serine hydrolase n=1 Tax=Aquirhabdus sp. TaxID=2824160 RepID=UPI00396CA7A8
MNTPLLQDAATLPGSIAGQLIDRGQITRPLLRGTVALGLISWLFAAQAHANLQISQSTVHPTAANNGQITWSDDSNSRASRLMHNDSDEDDDSPPASLTVDIRTLPKTPVSRSGSLSGLIESVRDKVTGNTSDTQTALSLNANAALVMDSNTGEVLYGKNVDLVRPMASITKLMTAMVTLDARMPMDEKITLQPEDFEGPKRASSSLRPFQTYNRAEVLLLALMKSENPAAAALARTYSQGRTSFMAHMNSKAKTLGMNTAFFGDPTGLDNRNSASPRDLAKMVKAAYEYEVIRRFSTTAEHDFFNDNGILHARNTNALVREGQWDIGLSKTGYISEAGRCVVMQARVNQRPTVIVLMDAQSSQGRTGDANRIMSWLGNIFQGNASNAN